MEKEQTEEFSLSLKGDGIDIQKNVDRKTALTILSVIWGQTPVAMSGPAAMPETSLHGQKVSLGEFLDDIGVTTNKQRIVAIGLFLRKHKGKDTFTKDDVLAGYRSAHEPLPKNVTRDIAQTAEARWIEETEPNGSYYVTKTGMTAVESKFVK